MKRKQVKAMKLADGQIASMRLDALRLAAGLPETETYGGMMGGSPQVRPGKTADKVIAEAEKLMAFMTKPSSK